jgi:methylenetetrahydrofolate reductase (NADPH)
MTTEIKTPSKLEKVLKAGHLAVTSECGPPRGSDAAVIKKKAETIKNYVDAINITDNQTSVTRLCSLASVIHLKLMGLEPILQMVTRDRNRTALQSDILGAASFDIFNILCLSGDHQIFGDNPKGQNVFDLDSMQLIQTVRHMRDEGKFLGGDPILRPTLLRILSKSGFPGWPRRSQPASSSFKPSAFSMWKSSNSTCQWPGTGD